MSEKIFNADLQARYNEVLDRVVGEGFETLEVQVESGEQNGYPVKRGDIVLYCMNAPVDVYAGYCAALVAALGLDPAEEFINRCVIGTMSLATENLLARAV